MVIMTEKELYELLENNPLKIPVYFFESETTDGDCLTVDYVGGRKRIRADNRSWLLSKNVQITYFSKKTEHRNEIEDFICEYFDPHIRYNDDLGGDNEDYVTVFDLYLIFKKE